MERLTWSKIFLLSDTKYLSDNLRGGVRSRVKYFVLGIRNIYVQFLRKINSRAKYLILGIRNIWIILEEG